VSLFELAQTAGGTAVVESTRGELEDIIEIARAEPSFGEFLSSRILPAKARRESLEKILKGRVSDLVRQFLLTLNQKDRLGHLAAIVAAYDEKVQEVSGRVEVDVYTATPISPEELGSIRARLQQVLGKEPVVLPYTDRSMIGGLRLQIGDQLIDGSVATRLRKMKDRLSEQGLAAVRAKAGRMIQD
jgi:F-type H+-transporting ATPase subunit delta